MNRPRFRETDDDVDVTIEKVLFCKSGERVKIPHRTLLQFYQIFYTIHFLEAPTNQPTNYK